MNGRFFLDTNILVYAVDGKPAGKAGAARDLMVRAVETGLGVISFQVVQECLNALTKAARKPLAPSLAKELLRTTLEPLCQVYPTSCALYHSALDAKERYRFHFYDCLIIAAALEARCTVLYSEDLQHGQRIGELRIENPFA